MDEKLLQVAVLALQLALVVVAFVTRRTKSTTPPPAAPRPAEPEEEDDEDVKRTLTNDLRVLQESRMEMPEVWRQYVDRRSRHQIRNIVQGPLLSLARMQLTGDARKLRDEIVRSVNDALRDPPST